MVLVMIALTVGTVIALTFLSGQTTSTAIAHNANRQVQARAVAEDGLEMALEHIRSNADPEWRDNFTHGVWSAEYPLNGGTFRVVLEDEDDADLGNDVSEGFTVTVEGRVDGVTHRVSTRVTPQGSAAAVSLGVLMVVPNATSLSSDDQARQALIESWGHTVTLISQNANASTFSAAIGDADVIYVSNRTSAGSVADDLTGATKGVVFEAGTLSDDLGLSSSYYHYSASYITVVDNSHPVTEGLPLGHVFVTESSSHLLAIVGSKASGLNALAQSDYGSYYTKLGVIERGEALLGGGVATGRRVAMPWGGSSFDFSKVSGDGKKIMRQAIAWAAGLSGSGKGKIQTGVVNVGAVPQTVSLRGFSDPVVVCTINYANNTQPVVVRMDEASSSGFTVWLENPSGAAVTNEDVYFIAVESGAHVVNGMKYEAQKYTSTRTDNNKSWVGEAQSYLQTYTKPVVIGQVMSANDDDWSVFWSYGNSRTNPPSGSALKTGKTVCEDSDKTRADETVGFIVFEEGHWEYSGATIDASVSADRVRGVQNSPPFTGDFEETFDEAPTIAVVTTAGLDGSDGGWAYLYGADPLSTTQVNLAMDEDQIRDSDRSHTTEQVAVVAVSGGGGGGDAPSLAALYEFVEPQPVTPQLVGHWKLDESGSASSGLTVGGMIRLSNDAKIDSYDAELGTYDSQTPEDAAVVSTNRTGSDTARVHGQSRIGGSLFIGVGGNTASDVDIQTSNGALVTGSVTTLPSSMDVSIPEPSGGIGSGSNMTHDGGTHTISSNREYKDWTVNNNAQITISGHVTITVSKALTMNEGSIIVPSGSSLTLYVKEGVRLNNSSSINPDTSGPDRVTLSSYHNTKGDITLNSTSVVSANVYAKDDLRLNNSAALYGSATVGDSFQMYSQSTLHLNAGAGGSGLVARDETGLSDGVYHGSVSGGQSGYGADAGTSVDFDGSDSFVAVPHNSAYLLDEGTVSFWVYPTSIGGTQGLVGKDAYNYEDGGHFRVVLNGSTVQVRLQSDRSSYYVQSSGGAISQNNWHHVAVGFGGQGLRLYIDGVLADTHHYYGGLGTSSGGSGNAEPWAFGVDQWRSTTLTTDGWDNPFEGRLDDIRIYDMNLETEQVADLLVGNSPGDAQSATVQDTSGNAIPLDLMISDLNDITWIDGGGLQIDRATTIVTPSGAEPLHGTLTESDAFTLEAEFTPANITQNGPARIVSYASSTSSRNFYLGQSEQAYEASVRTEFNSTGTPTAASGDVLEAGVKQHVVLSYDGEQLRLYRNGTLEVAEEWTGDLDNWDSGFQLLLGNENGGSRPWLGTLHRVAIWDGPVNSIQADNLFNGDEPGPPDGGEEGLSYLAEWIESP